MQAVIRPGLSFKDRKRDTEVSNSPDKAKFCLKAFPEEKLMPVTENDCSDQAVTEPVRDEGEEAFAQSKQHDYFECEGPGLGSMLRKIAQMSTTTTHQGSGVSVQKDEAEPVSIRALAVIMS